MVGVKVKCGLLSKISRARQLLRVLSMDDTIEFMDQSKITQYGFCDEVPFVNLLIVGTI